jgi:cell division protein FtsI (penicillin-binding protein 3)
MALSDQKRTQWAEHAPDVLVITPEVARQVTAMLEVAASPQGTGSLAQIPGYRVAGKTGTAQKLDPVTGAYSSERYMAWFAGYLPADDPKAVIVVAVDEPQEEHTGGQVAAPVFAEIATAAMQHMGVLPTSLPAQMPQAEEDTTLAQQATQTEEPPWVDEVRFAEGRIPSFIGMTAAEALDTYVEHRMDVDIEVHGSGTVVRQDPSVGSDVGRTRRVRLYLAQQ